MFLAVPVIIFVDSYRQIVERLSPRTLTDRLAHFFTTVNDRDKNYRQMKLHRP